MYVANEFRKIDSGESSSTEAQPYVTMFQIFTSALGYNGCSPGPGLARTAGLGPRIGRILRKHGWRRRHRGPRGSREYQYHPPVSWDWQAVLTAADKPKE